MCVWCLFVCLYLCLSSLLSFSEAGVENLVFEVGVIFIFEHVKIAKFK